MPSGTLAAGANSNAGAAPLTDTRIEVLKPKDIVMSLPPLQPADPSLFAWMLEFNAMLKTNHHTSSDAADQIEQALSIFAPVLRSAMIVAGARDFTTLSSLFDAVQDRYPDVSSIADSWSSEVLQFNTCSDNQDTYGWIASLNAAAVRVMRHSSLPEWDRASTEQDRQWLSPQLAAVVLDNCAPADRVSFRLSRDGLVAGSTTLDALLGIQRQVESSFTNRTRNKRDTTSTVLSVIAGDKLQGENARLRAALAAAKATGGRSTGRTSGPPSNCRFCKLTPISVGGGKPGNHWHSICPKNPGRDRDPDSE